MTRPGGRGGGGCAVPLRVGGGERGRAEKVGGRGSRPQKGSRGEGQNCGRPWTYQNNNVNRRFRWQGWMRSDVSIRRGLGLVGSCFSSHLLFVLLVEGGSRIASSPTVKGQWTDGRDVERVSLQDNATGRQATLFDQWRCATGQQPTRMCVLARDEGGGGGGDGRRDGD